MSTIDHLEELSELFLFMADADFGGYCPLYEQLARWVATQSDLLDFISTSANPNARRGRIPVLFFAATHERVLADPSSELAAIYRGESSANPVDAFTKLVETQRTAIANSMRTRSVQTNEVGRSAVLALGVERAVNDIHARIDLFEIGPSAGLNLFFDQFHITYLRNSQIVATRGPQSSTVHLEGELRSALLPKTETSALLLGSRIGIDPNPIDVVSEDQCRWLEACLWPGIPDRPQRLEAALALASAAPPHLIRGDAALDLSTHLATLSDDNHLVIFSTWALSYIATSGRENILEVIDRLGETRDLDFLTFEEPKFAPWIEKPLAYESYLGEGTPTVLGLRSWRQGTCTSTPLAIAHPHGRWIHWVEEIDG
ncbi:MAG: DUF2332 domain-containing protein [Acidimicrobiales bacterium]